VTSSVDVTIAPRHRRWRLSSTLVGPEGSTTTRRHRQQRLSSMPAGPKESMAARRHRWQRLSSTPVAAAGPEESTAALVIHADIVIRALMSKGIAVDIFLYAGVVVGAKADVASLALRRGACIVIGVVFLYTSVPCRIDFVLARFLIRWILIRELPKQTLTNGFNALKSTQPNAL
jgi:hypothetical protein